MYEQNVLLRSYKSFKHTFNHALLESKISGTISFAQWWVLDLTLETLRFDRIRKQTGNQTMLEGALTRVTFLSLQHPPAARQRSTPPGSPLTLV